MLQIKNLVILVVFFAMVQCQPSKEVPYLKSYARDTPYTFLCNSDRGIRVNASGKLFHCNATLCTSTDAVCDSVIDCPNFADENKDNCTDEWKKYCAIITKKNNGKPFNGTDCDNGMCITECDVCDGQYRDCSDNSDEESCSDQRPHRLRCENYYAGFPEEFLIGVSSWPPQSELGVTLLTTRADGLSTV